MNNCSRTNGIHWGCSGPARRQSHPNAYTSRPLSHSSQVSSQWRSFLFGVYVCFYWVINAYMYSLLICKEIKYPMLFGILGNYVLILYFHPLMGTSDRKEQTLSTQRRSLIQARSSGHFQIFLSRQHQSNPFKIISDTDTNNTNSRNLLCRFKLITL